MSHRALAPVDRWPGDAPAAVSLTFDFDGESPILGDPHHASPTRLTSRSEGRFGIVRGLPRILETLARFDVHATFFVPGHTARIAADAVRAIAAAGHEVGHHGDLHRHSHLVDDELQRHEIERGLEALSTLQIVPDGYRSPAWELTPCTRDLLYEHGFRYDSSLMEDDRPYREAWEHGRSILELPPHWSLDDVPYFKYTLEAGGAPAHPAAVLEIWTDELERALRESRHVVLTMHPEVSGRGARLSLLEGVLEWAVRHGLWIAPMRAVADVVDVAGRVTG